MILSTNSSAAYSVEWPSLNPYQLLTKSFLLSKYEDNSLARILSITLETTGRRDIDR